MDDKAHGTGRLEHTDGATYDGHWRASMKQLGALVRSLCQGTAKAATCTQMAPSH